MSNLWKETPEAEDFVEEVTKNLDKFLLFKEETFGEINSAILGTSNIDSQKEAFDSKALQKFVKRIEDGPVWLNVEHNPLIQPHGRIIAAKLFYASNSEIYFLAGVIGKYSEKSFIKFAEVNITRETLLEADLPDLPFDVKKEDIFFSFSPHEIETNLISEILKESPQVVSKNVRRSIRKGADPIAILTMFVSIYLLANNPFSKKFLEAYGEKSAKVSIDFFTWLKEKVFTKFNKIKNERVLFEFVAPYKNCKAKFVIASKDVETLCEASISIHNAARSAAKLIDYLEEAKPDTLVYEFNLDAKKWIPLHITTEKHGIITDQPYLIAIDKMSGMSIGGMA